MVTAIALSLTCWLCVLLATPRPPRAGDEDEELVHAHLVGRRHRVEVVALVVTLGAYVVCIALVAHRA
jgi:hypothetical protein